MIDFEYINNSTPLEAALFYARNGIAIAPVKPRTKDKFFYYPEYPGRPSDKFPEGNPYSWQGQATTDEARIKRYFSDHPDANICAAWGTQSKNIFVIDFDNHPGAESGFESKADFESENHCKLPDTISVITGEGSGEHYFYIGNGNVKKEEGIYPGIDVRANGSYSLLPPSIHPNGTKYQWEASCSDFSEMAQADEVIYKFLRMTKDSSSKGISSNKQYLEPKKEEYKLPDVIPVSKRNKELHKLAASLHGKGLPENVVRAAVLEANKQCCTTPLLEDEVLKLIASVFNSEALKRPKYISVSKQGGDKVNTSALAEHIRRELKYIIVREPGRNSFFIYVYEDGYYKLYSPDLFKGIIKKYITDYSLYILKMHDVEETYRNLITDLNFRTTEEINSNEDLVNFENGFVKITKNNISLIPHDSAILSTIRIPTVWTAEQKPTPIFDAYISKLTNGNKGIEKLLLEFIGACISNVKFYRMKKALFMFGDGDTGKSQLKALTEKIIGEGNFMAVDLPELEARFGTSNVYNKRLVGSSDMTFATVKEMKIFKKLTGGDSIDVEFKGQDTFSYKYNGALWFCMNKLIKFGGDNGQWVYNRIIPIRCTNVIPEANQDKQLLDKLYSEREGIIHKCILALQDVIKNGYTFTEPQEIKALRKEYIEMNSTAITFFKECMTERTTDNYMNRISSSRCYKVYAAWCKDMNNGYVLSQAEFRTALSDYLNASWDELTRRENSGVFMKDFTLTMKTFDEYRNEAV